MCGCSSVPRTFDAGFDVGEFLDGAQVDARIVDRAAGEDQPAALDVELAPIGGVLALGHRQFPGRAREGIVAAADGDAAGESAGEPGGVDGHAIAQAQRDVAHRLQALGRIFLFAADDHFIGRGARRAGEVLGLDPGVRHRDLAGHFDPAPLDVELQIG